MTNHKDLLKSSETQSRDWLENSPVCTKIIDADFNLQYMSHAGINGLKIPDVQEYYGKPYPFEFFPEWSKKSVIENLEKVKETGKVISIEMSAFDLEQNELWYHATLTPVHKEDGSLDYIMVVSSEITERIKAQEKLRIKNEEIAAQNRKYEELNQQLERYNQELTEAKTKAEESEKLKSAFLANMSHEIRTPLNSILGFTNLLKMGNDIEEHEKEEFFGFIDAGGRRLLRIISDIVDISKIDTGQISIHLKDCDLDELLESLQSQLAIQLSDRLDLVVAKPLQKLPNKVQIDVTRVSQILSNLVENAGKFTKRGTIEFGYQRSSSFLEFYVKDEGIGIPASEQASIFDRFRQADNEHTRSGSGTGLGLSIAQELVHLMGGKIWVKSQEGQGATFFFTLPYLPAESHNPNQAKNGPKPRTNHGTSILIAEDEPVNFIYLKALLKPYQYHVLHAKDGREAVKMTHDNPDIDLVLMDLRMPYLSGIEATLEIRKTHPDLPIIAQTAFAMAEDKQVAYEAGVNNYLEKPLSKNQLEEVLAKHLP